MWIYLEYDFLFYFLTVIAAEFSFLKINFSFFNLILLYYATTESPILFKLGCFMAFSLFMAFNCVTLIFKTDEAFPERV